MTDEQAKRIEEIRKLRNEDRFSIRLSGDAFTVRMWVDELLAALDEADGVRELLKELAEADAGLKIGSPPNTQTVEAHRSVVAHRAVMAKAREIARIGACP